MKKASNNKSTKERFEYYSSKPNENGCIEWLGARDKNGYGRIKPSGEKRIRAHRYSYQQTFGEIPEGMVICHHCDNPPCVNPSHLFLGTYKDNALDRSKKGRGAKNNLAGCPMKMLPNSKLTKEDVLNIREMIKYKVPQITIAKMYNIHRSTVLHIKKRFTWYHI